MSGYRLRAIGATFAALILAAAATPVQPVTLDYIGTFVWSSSEESFGGFSGIEISEDGGSFHAITDRAHIYWGSIDRGTSGRIRGMNIAGRAHLKDSRGNTLPPGRLGDSEGLAIGDDGRIWITFEGLDRLAAYDTPDSPAARIPRPPILPELKINSGLEALAITREGALLAIPERSGDENRPFPVLRWWKDTWDVPFQIPREGRWLPTGADIGPDDKLYLLERDFRGLAGFSSRVRRFNLDGTGAEVLLETRPMQYDNLEGIAVWHDGIGMRLTMISDDNFNFLQRTEIVEYRLRE